MSQLAEPAGPSKSRISHAVARLEERGWIRRRDCPTDRRGQLAELTDEGYAVLVEAAPGHVEQVRRTLFDPLTPEQVRQLHAITGSILAAVGTPPPCEDGDGCPGSPAPPLTSGRPAGRGAPADQRGGGPGAARPESPSGPCPAPTPARCSPSTRPAWTAARPASSPTLPPGRCSTPPPCPATATSRSMTRAARCW